MKLHTLEKFFFLRFVELPKQLLPALSVTQHTIAQSENYQPTSPPITTSPPRTAPEDMLWLMECGTTEVAMGNSTGLVLTMRTTLPDPGVSKMQKNGRSQPSSV